MINRKLVSMVLVCASVLAAGAQARPARYLNKEAEQLKVASGRYGDPQYTGDDKTVAKAFESYKRLFDLKIFSPWDESADTLTVEQKIRLLDSNFAEFIKEVSAIESPEMKKFLTTLGNDVMTNRRIRLEDDSVKREQLYNYIDVNSWIGLYNYLPIWKIENALSKPDYDVNTAPWGLEYIASIDKNITDPAVKHAMLNSCAEQVLEWGKCPDVDDFWIPFCDFAGNDSDIVKKYSPKVKSLKTTAPGMKSIDFAFTDRDGKQHHLSDFFGKVIYVDVWASWCGPCRAEIPHIERHFNEYYKNNDKVMFLSISVDEDRDDWIKALDADKPQWSQFNVTGNDHISLSEAYGIGGIPRFMIFNADGTIHDADAFRPSDKEFRTKLDAVISL